MASDSENDDVDSNERPSSDVEEEEDVEDDPADPATSEASDRDDDSDDDDDEDEEDEEPRPSQPAAPQPQTGRPPPAPRPLIKSQRDETPTPRRVAKSPTPPSTATPRIPSPAGLRKLEILNAVNHPRTYTVEAIGAIPHPTPTHALAASMCLTHLFTGSEDGYIRDYDVYTAANSKNFLTTAQRSHCGVIEGTMKSGHLRYWWENPAEPSPPGAPPEEIPLAPIYSMASHSDAMWTLAGSSLGRINLFTARHAPGTLIHSFAAHNGPVSAICLDLNETGFFSAGWDGSTLQWDLNTGQRVRTFAAHGAQIAAVAVRPLVPPSPRSPSPMDVTPATVHMNIDPVKDEEPPMTLVQNPASPTLAHDLMQTDARSDADFDPLFDEETSDAGGLDSSYILPMLGSTPVATQALPAPPVPRAPAPMPEPQKFAPMLPPLLDAGRSGALAPDLLMTTSIDGQVMLWDRRVAGKEGVGRLWMDQRTPPWCVSACWSADGAQIYAGRRNGTIDVWDVRRLGRAGPRATPTYLKAIKNPPSSGMVACVVAFPDGKHIACASNDNIRLWNVPEATAVDQPSGRGVQFKIVPGHHGGFVSQMLVDPAARFLISASSDRGWGWGESSRTIFVHDIKKMY